MLAFEVSQNGKRVCIMGTDGQVAGVGVMWSRRNPDRINFHVGGINDSGDHIAWDTTSLRLGDEIMVRLVEVASPDLPDRTYKPHSRDQKQS